MSKNLQKEMRGDMKLKLIGKKCILFLILLYLAINLSKLLFPIPQFHIYLGNYDENGSISIFTYEQNGTEYVCEKNDNKYNADVIFNNKHYKFEFCMIDLELSNLKINTRKVLDNNVYYLSNLSVYPNYKDVIVVCIPNFPLLNIITAIIIFCIFNIILFKINSSIKNSGETVKEKLIYSHSSIDSIGYKPIIVSLFITLVTSAIHYGCDISTFIGVINMQQSNIDIYQLQSSMDSYIGQSFIMWPYNYTMLMFYDIILFLNRILIPFFHVDSYNLLQIIFFKIVGMLLINLTVLSIISFLIDEKMIVKNKAKEIYYCSIFNPLTFWIVIIYMQLDAFPVYCITLGVLMLNNLKKDYLLCALFLSLGLCAKTQTLLIVPVVFSAFILMFITYKGDFNGIKEKFIYGIRCVCITVLYFVIFLGVFYIKKEAFFNSIAHVPQAERAWWTVVTYAPNLYLYITIAGIVLFFMLNVFEFKQNVEKKAVIINTLYAFASIILMLSFGIISTPGIFVNCLPAFVLLYSFSEDNLQRLIFAVGGIFIVLSEMFNHMGDITQSLVFFNYPPFFTMLEQKLSGTPEGIKYGSLLFTVAHTAMLAYAILFYKKGKHILFDK